jgi:hypothetical protein
MLSQQLDPAIYGTVMFYSVDVYEHIRDMSWLQIQLIAQAASAILGEHALCRDKSGEFPKFDLPTYAEKKSLPYCLAVTSASVVWGQKHLADNELPNSTLLDAAYMGYQLWKGKTAHDESH